MKYTSVICHGIKIKSLTINELLEVAGKVQQQFKNTKKDNISEAMIRNTLVSFLNYFVIDTIPENAVTSLTSLQLDDIWTTICDMNPQLKLLNMAGAFLIKMLENNPELLLHNK